MGAILRPILGIDFGSENGFGKVTANVARHLEKKVHRVEFQEFLLLDFDPSDAQCVA